MIIITFLIGYKDIKFKIDCSFGKTYLQIQLFEDLDSIYSVIKLSAMKLFIFKN